MPTHRHRLAAAVLSTLLLTLHPIALRSAQAQVLPGGPAKAEPNAAQFDPVKIAGPTDSSAITQQGGDVFYGPGPITVGWLGAKKQVLVPSGRWVLLSAEDGLSGHTPPIPLTTLVLARLEGSAVQSFLLARFNSKSGNSRSTWPEAQTCQGSPSYAPFAWRETSSGVTECVTSALRAPPNAATMLAHPFWKAPLQALAKAGGTVANSSYLVTEMSYSGDLSNYMKVTRIDFNVSAIGASPASNVPGQAAAIDWSVAGRKQWAQAYAPLAALGYRKKLAEDELYAGSKPTSAVASLPD